MTFRSIALLALVVSLLAACSGASVRPDGGKGLLPAGALAPEMVGIAADGSQVALSASRGRAAIVYFYPKDATPGCTKEACAFRDAFKQYQARQVTIFGVSRDSDEVHQEFRAQHALPFPLVSDADGSIAQAYGVPSPLGMSSRVSFLIGPDGKVVRVWPDVDPGIHAHEVLAAAEASLSPVK